MTAIFETYIKSSPENIKGFLMSLLLVMLDESNTKSETNTVCLYTKSGFTKNNVKEVFLSSYLLLKQKSQKEFLSKLLSKEFNSREKTEDLFCEIIELINDFSICPDDHVDTNLLYDISAFGSVKVLDRTIKASNLDINKTSEYEVTNESCFSFLSSQQKHTIDDNYIPYLEALTKYNIDANNDSNKNALMGLFGFIEYAEVLSNNGFFLQDILIAKWQYRLESHCPNNYMEEAIGQWLNASTDNENKKALRTIKTLAEHGIENCPAHFRTFFDKSLVRAFFYKHSNVSSSKYKDTRITSQTIRFIQLTSTFLGENWLWDNNQSELFPTLNKFYKSSWGEVVAKAILNMLPLDYIAKSARNKKDALKIIEHFNISAYDLMLKVDNEEVKGELLSLMDA
jgi:hypothetical protein